MKFTGVMLGTDNPKKLGDFYTKVLGKPDWQQDGWYGFWKGDSGMIIGEHSEVKGKSKNPQRMIIAFETKDVKAEFKRIKGIGAEVVAEPYQPGMDKKGDTWLATFADPDGNYFQIATPWKS